MPDRISAVVYVEAPPHMFTRITAPSLTLCVLTVSSQAGKTAITAAANRDNENTLEIVKALLKVDAKKQLEYFKPAVGVNKCGFHQMDVIESGCVGVDK